MATVQRVDACGLRCPHPVLVLGNATVHTAPGTIVEVTADCPSFEQDVRAYCQRRGKTVLAVLGVAPRLTVQILF